MDNYTQTFLSLAFWLKNSQTDGQEGVFWSSLLARIYVRKIQNTKSEVEKAVNVMKNDNFFYTTHTIYVFPEIKLCSLLISNTEL